MKGKESRQLAISLTSAAVLLAAGLLTHHEVRHFFFVLATLAFAGVLLTLWFPSRDHETELYRWVAHKGEAKAQRDLALTFFHGFIQDGLDVPPDYTKAVEWFLKAAAQGDVEAQGYLADCYATGKGVAQNDVEAAKWYLKAAEHGDKIAQNSLGLCYENGRGVTQNHSRSAEWYRNAAEQEFAPAQYNLGLCYYDGKGLEQNYAEAARWFRKAAEYGLDRAQNSLGICYYEGHGVTQDYIQAVEWYRKAADKGYDEAQCNLAGCYYDGRGVERDYVEAYKWYNLISIGKLFGRLEIARKRRDELKAKMTTDQIAEALRRVEAFRPK